MKRTGRQCVQIDNTYCPNHPKSKQYSEKSTERCKDTCKIDLSCTGGYHWHHGDVCYHFGVEGAVDDECKGRTIEVVSPPQSHGFDCRAIPGKNLNVLNDLILMQISRIWLKNYNILDKGNARVLRQPTYIFS